MLENNPLISSYDLPPFSAIRAEHLLPAIAKIISDSRIKVTGIIDSQTLYPTWDDLVLAMDEVKAQLDDTVQAIDIVSSVMTQETWSDAAKRCSDLVTAYKAQLAQSNELFELYQKLSNSQIAELFDEPRRRVLKKILREFRLSGIHLPQDQQQRLVGLNSDINRQEREFKLRVQQSSNAWSKHIEDDSLLAGLPDAVKFRMENEAQEKNLQGWLVSLSDEQFRAVMLHAEHRPLRKEVWVAYHSRASAQGLHADQFNNDDVLTSLLDARHEKAKLLGYENFAQLALEGQTAESTDQVLAFLRNVLDEQRSVIALEAQQLKELAAQQGITHLEPWDYEYLAEKIRQHAGVSQEELRAYFPLDTVLSRLCRFTQRLFGVELLERSDFDSWHEDVRLFEVREYEQTIGYLFIDPYRRELAGGLAETLGLRNRRVTAEGRPRLPIAVLRSKLTPGVGDKPCLLDHLQLRALLHEFGHCLQQLLTGEQYRDISGLNGLGHDTVEFTGQVLEQWCFSKEFLIWMSSHYQTGEPIPADMVDPLMTVIRTQTSWTTANLLLIMHFDFEVHRTYGDERSAQEVFDALNTEVGHLQWPESVRPFNSGEFIASSYAARVYSYKWSGVLASTAFDQFISNGVFDPDTGRAFREAFFTHGDSRSLMQSLEVFLGAPYTGRLIPSPDAGDLPQADSTTDPSAPLISQLNTSQQLMIRLNDAVPRASEVATQYLNYWFKRTFPALAASVTVEELSVRTRREEVIPQSESTADRPAVERTVTDTVPLGALFWRALAGKINTRELFREMGNVDIVIDRNNSTQMPAALNSHDAKGEIKWLLNTTPVLYKPLLAQALDDFWNKPADFSQDRNVSDWLADEFSTQLGAQADLHKLDGTLSPQMHKVVTDYALSAPDAASRAAMAERVRPGVHSLSRTPEGWGFSVQVPRAVALTRHDNAENSGGAVLYRPGNPLEVYENLTVLKNSLNEDGDAQDEVNTPPLEENFLARLVTDLRAEQKTTVSNVLLDGPGEGEEVTAWVSRMEVAADVGDKLDLAGAMDERELRLKRKKQDDWLRGKPYVTGSDRVAWWKAVQDLHKTVADMPPPPPDPVTLATPDALRERTRALLAPLINKYASVDPDQVFLTIEREKIDPNAPTGGSTFGSGISQGAVVAISVYRDSMTEWAMSNLTPEERDVPNPLLEGPMSYAQFKDVIERADVGARLLTELPLTARGRQAEWMSLKEKQIRAQAWAAHISSDFRHDRDNTGLNLVLAALDSPTPEGRRKVNEHEVEVRQLRWGDSVLKEILAFGVKTLASRPSLTLYTPGAPDGKMFRDVDAGSDRELKTALARTLTATPQMTQWLISQLPLLEQTEQLASLVPTSENQTLEEKIKKVTQSVFSWAKDRAQNDFALKVSSTVVEGNLLEALHETQITHAIKTADMLTVTNAERDSAAAQEGRRNGVALLTGALSMSPAGRLGGILGRAVLPVMTGGAAVSAIKDEGGSFSQWTSDFISGLGEVLAEAGQDLIMARAGRHRGKARPALSSLPRMQDPELKPFRLRGFDGTGLVPEGRNRYRDAGGQGYLKLGKHYYKTAMQGGERIVYAPDNRTNQRTVTWENGRWQVEERQRLLGGGPVQSLFSRIPETPAQKKYNVLVEGVLTKYRNPSPEVVNLAREMISSMPDELAERILNESMRDAGVSDIDTYRSRISELEHRRSQSAQHQTQHDNLLYKYHIWEAIQNCTKDFEENVAGMHFTATQKIKMFDTMLPFINEAYDSVGKLKVRMSTMPDNFTGAVYIVITPGRGRKSAALDKLQKEFDEMISAAEAKAMADLKARYPGDGPESVDVRRKHLEIPENREAYRKNMINILREEMKARNKPGLLTEIKSKGIHYLIVNKGKSQRKIMLATETDVKNFTNDLPKYTDTFDIEAVTKVPSKQVTGTTPTVTDPPVLPAAPAATDKFKVDTGPLAEAQMSYDNFPETARTKITEIMDDIRAGRATTKRIRGYYWYDMTQLDPGSGRGAWRAAFERKGDTWVLQGFYDYHANKPATVWGD